MLCAANISQAQAGSVIISDYSKFQTWSNAAHSKTADTKIKVFVAPCPNGEIVGGCTVFSNPPKIYIHPTYNNSYDQNIMKQIFYHELGHVYDWVHNDGRRAVLRELLGYPSNAYWWDIPVEHFAEAAKICYLGYNSAYWYGETLPYSQTLEVCRFMNRVESGGGSGSQG